MIGSGGAGCAHDDGRPLDGGVRGQLERAFGADLSAVRIHTGPAADRAARALGADAFTRGSEISFAKGRFRPETEEGLWLLAHEVTHALQQSRGPVAGPQIDPYEREADRCAGIVLAGLRLEAPIHHAVTCSVGREPVIQRHVSFEHRLLGDGPTPDLVTISTGGANRAQILSNQISLLQLWQHDPGGVKEADVARLCPWIRTVRLGPDHVLATYGELNALPDYLADPEAFNQLDRDVLLPILQVIRQEGYNQLTLLNTNSNPNVRFHGSACAPWSLSMVNSIIETGALDTLTLGLGVKGENHYQGLLARNACHFAPFSWYRWQAYHMIARDLARRANATKDARLTERAWAFHGYADHFLQDSFAAGHLVNKTLVMQWFIAWAAGQSLLPVADWEQIKNMTTLHQPELAGLWLYDPTYQGPSNDPQTAQEAATLVDRILASSVAADGPTPKQVTYQHYLTFLTSAVTQLASANLHDHYNDNSLWVSSIATSTPYEVWGDDTLFTGSNGGQGVQNTSEAAQLSQQALSQILATGATSISVQQIRERFPTTAGPSAAVQQDLGTWNQTQTAYCLQTFADFTPVLKTLLTGLASPRLGVVSQDQAFASVWSTSLPDCKYNPVDTVVAGGRVFTGSNGYVYELNPTSGKVLHKLLVTGKLGVGNYETKLATDDTTLFVGVHGYVYGVSLSDWSRPAWYLGVGGTGNYPPVSVLVYGSRLFAGSNGYVYEVDPGTGKQLHSLLVTSLLGSGNYTTRIATDGKTLFAGVHGYVYGVPLSKWSSAWNSGVGGTGQYEPVTVLVHGSKLFAGSNGYVYEFDPATGKQRHSLLVTGKLGVGDYDSRLTTNGTSLYVGVHGYVYAVALGSWNATAWYTGVGGTASYHPVSVLSRGGRLFAASNGYIYQLSHASGKVTHTLLLTYLVGVGNFDTGLATDGRDVYAGVHGYANKIMVTDQPKGTQRMLVTVIANNMPDPVSAQYTSGGGTLLVQFSGSAWTATAAQMISATLNLDNVPITSASVFANNAQTHLALVPASVLLPGVKPGVHTFTVTPGNATTVDLNDLFTITVYEYFLS